MKNTFKNAGVWTSIFALIGLLLKDFGVYPADYDLYVTIIGGLLVYFGITSNPVDGKWYKNSNK
jgi:hypothetical protein